MSDPSQPNARAGPSYQRLKNPETNKNAPANNMGGAGGVSRGGGVGGGGGGGRGKIIRPTTDLLRQNHSAKAAGKGKHKAILGDLEAFTRVANNLPGALQVERFAEARALEILALQNAIKLAAANNTSRAFQSLPRHLRRRAASHNPRRVPKKMRGKAAAEIDPSDPTVRRHRKKARLLARGNLRGESRTAQLRKRQRSKSWLATHLFHAKRFHMTNLWGYRIPLSPTLKSFRPALRAARRKVTLHDASYLRTITVRGKKENVVRLLSRTVAGPFAGSKYENGSRVAQVLVYHPDAFPKRLIGPAEHIWATNTNDSTTVILRVHPSISAETLTALKQCNVPHVQVEAMKHDVASFELMGPWAGRIIRRSFRICRGEDQVKQNFFQNLPKVTPNQVPDGLVAGMMIYDPRLHFPPPRILDLSRGARDSDDDNVVLSAPHLTPSPELASSSLWNDEKRTSATPSFKKSELDRRRHQLGMPGTRLRPLAQDDRIPIIIVKKTISPPPSCIRNDEDSNQGFHGYTLLFPSAWSMAFLNSLVYAGAFLTGLEERRILYREAGVMSFPEHYGNVCQAGRDWEVEEGEKERKRWERKPRGKRAEYAALGVDSPFIPDWSQIIDTGISEEERGINGDEAIQPWLFTDPLNHYLKSLISSPTPRLTLLSMINAWRSQRRMNKLSISLGYRLMADALLHVRVEVLGRGSPSDMAVIYALKDLREREEWVKAIRQGDRDLLAESVMSEVQRLGEHPVERKKAIGYVSTGNFSFFRGRGHAMGIITLKSYLELIQIASKAASEGDKSSSIDGEGRRALVKVKNTNGHICRLAAVCPV